MTNTTQQPPHSGAIRSPGSLGSPTLTFDLTAEIKGLREENAWQGGRNSKTLVKNEDFRIVLTELQSNALVHEQEHWIAARSTRFGNPRRSKEHTSELQSPI